MKIKGIDMEIPYRQSEFEAEYLPLARLLTKDDPDRSACIKLCQRVYQLLSPQDLRNDRKVHLKFLEEHHGPIADRQVSPTAQAIVRLYGKNASDIFVKPFVPIEGLLKKVTPVLKGLSLFDCLVAALRILGWDYHPIADLINTALSDLSPDKVQSPLTPSEARKLLKKVRNTFASRLPPADAHCAWLKDLISYEGDITLEAETLKDMRNFLTKAPDVRFGRIGNLDQHGWLRDHWDSSKKNICQSLGDVSAFQVKGKGETNEH